MNWRLYVPIPGRGLMNQIPFTTLAMNTWSEARGEPFEGQVAVAHVVLNRAARTPRWPAAPSDVVLQAAQFSWTLDPNYVARALRPDATTFRIALAATHAAVEGIYPDPTLGADHYFADYIPRPAWAAAMKELKKIGRHIFLRENDAHKPLGG